MINTIFPPSVGLGVLTSVYPIGGAGLQGRYDELTGWYDFHARQYDAALGRCFGVDPQNQFTSPYLAMGNNPVMMVDPDGELAWFVPIIAGAVINTALNATNINSGWDALGYAADGGASGALGMGIASGMGWGLTVSGMGGSFGSAFSTGFGMAFQGSVQAAGIGGGFFAGALTGASSGFAAGFSNGLGNSLIGGSSFGSSLSSGLNSGAKSGLAGGLMGGIGSGISAAKRGGSFWNGVEQRNIRPSLQYKLPGLRTSLSNRTIGPLPITATQENLNSFITENFGEYGRYNWSIDRGSILSGGKYGETTGYTSGKIERILVSSKAFTNPHDLYLITGHEARHVDHFIIGKMGSWISNFGGNFHINITEAYAWDWTASAISNLKLNPSLISLQRALINFEYYLNRIPNEFTY